ncbi:NAD(P)/FAD-dependent oxidoreductase [Planktothrix sp. FACHB-1365]|uniref:NAD(P)/FAD-dependent oxidoreductase n=1 Tax=Planktothrix sp. FACHB-1365 TaxID=2692855 RepID=UPI001689CA04|nr:FAD-dependent oxidoreductase [Planktothrix sp. FACHB-1365]MBD2480655.1 FAD-dependent oxidoreductase [Planktothrix sp. FACHB-1365]
MNSIIFDVAVIGAGVSGLTCAQQFKKAGYSVIILDKSRGVGGRMATRRLSGTRADHGVRYLEAKGEQLQQLIEQLKTCEPLENQLQLWTNTVYEFKDNKLQIPAISQPYYIIPSGMSTVGKFLAQGLNIRLNSRVNALTITPEKTWQCHIESINSNAIESSIIAKFVVIAIPAPQVLMLLEASNIAIESNFIASIKSVEYDPCITVIAGYSIDKSQALPKWRAVSFSDDKILDWVGVDSSKRLNPTQPVFVIQSNRNFAEQYLEETDLTLAGEQLIHQAANTLLPELKTPDWLQIHRWRYGFCRKPLSVSCLTTLTPLPLVCAGDWCGGNQIEGALKSGIEATNWLQTQTSVLKNP